MRGWVFPRGRRPLPARRLLPPSHPVQSQVQRAVLTRGPMSVAQLSRRAMHHMVRVPAMLRLRVSSKGCVRRVMVLEVPGGCSGVCLESLVLSLAQGCVVGTPGSRRGTTRIPKTLQRPWYLIAGVPQPRQHRPAFPLPCRAVYPPKLSLLTSRGTNLPLHTTPHLLTLMPLLP